MNKYALIPGPDLSTGLPCSPGSLECLSEGLASLFTAMDDLTYQLELSDSFDSGNGTEEDDEDDMGDVTEADNQDGSEAVDLATCGACDRLVSKVWNAKHFRMRSKLRRNAFSFLS